MATTADIHLDLRQRSVMAALVYEYIASGEPVGSRTLSRRYELGVSAATIRNSMTDLEDKGLVHQPHTSAGRIPTDLGIRVFVDSLMEIRDLSEPERQVIESRYGEVLLSSDGWSHVVRLLSEMSQQPAVVRSPDPEGMVLQQVRFVPMTTGQVLAVLIGASGMAQSRLLRVQIDLSPSTLERIHNYLNELVPGRTLHEARQMIERQASESKESMDRFALQALELGRGALDDVDVEPRVVVYGQAKLIQEGTLVDVDRLRELMHLLDDQQKLAKLLEATAEACGPFIVIGAEHPVTEVAECAVIAAPYSRGADAWGALAVIGPRTMNYAKMVPLVGFTAQVLSTSDEAEAEED